MLGLFVYLSLWMKFLEYVILFSHVIMLCILWDQHLPLDVTIVCQVQKSHQLDHPLLFCNTIL